MNTLFEIDNVPKNCGIVDVKNNRRASRAIVIIDGKILLIQSSKFKEFKFPGGGCEQDEFLKDTLKREVLEESGFEVVANTIKEFGKTIERHIDSYDKTKIFIQTSYYFTCEVCKSDKKRNLDLYEIEYGYEPKLVNIDEAILQNQILLAKNDPIYPTWIKRELEVLKIVKERFFK